MTFGTLNDLRPFLGDANAMIAESSTGSQDRTYIHPALKNAGSVSLVLVREAIAPAIIRNQDEEMTDIDIAGERHLRATPSKFKHKEKGRGLQILRHFGVGGRFPQNRIVVNEKDAPSTALDINAFVFGESANRGKNVLPVKAAVMYSHGVGLQPYDVCVGQTFHNRANESGTLWNDEEKKNSNNIFTRHFVKPGAVYIQTLSTSGRLMPLEALVHLLLSVGEAGAYGGQTSLTGTNFRTRIVGAYASRFEHASTVPDEIVKALRDQHQDLHVNVDAVVNAIHAIAAPGHNVVLTGAAMETERARLMAALSANDPALAAMYEGFAPQVGTLFDAWFTNMAGPGAAGDEKAGRGRSKKAARGPR